jgi:hypothetical protein
VGSGGNAGAGAEENPSDGLVLEARQGLGRSRKAETGNEPIDDEAAGRGAVQAEISFLRARLSEMEHQFASAPPAATKASLNGWDRGRTRDRMANILAANARSSNDANHSDGKIAAEAEGGAQQEEVMRASLPQR